MKTTFKVYEIYLFYNQPCLLAYISKLNNYYLAVWVEELSLYLFSKVSLNDLNILKNDSKLICRDLFINSNHSFLYDVESEQIVEELQTIPKEYLSLN